ncbi:hypothetical protein M8J75_009055 [Diaphorina citri]|nr:hypothetical protein M8J75_009055 [Diaphorina citri]
MSPKTPVSILHEYCILHHCVPEYIPKSEEKTSKTDTIFTFELYLFNEYVSGSGTSKKAAKHETARALLKLLAEKDPELKSFLKENGLDDDTKIETPYVHHNSENYVGKLEVLCLLNNLPTPVYNQLYEEGMSHDKTFTCTCKLGNLLVEASHRTKQQAKHTSALLMIESLEKSLEDAFITTVPEDFRMDYKSDDFSIERKKVRTHLLMSERKHNELKFNAVRLPKLHRVITEPHLEVISTMQRILDDMAMTTENFNEYLDNENLATLDKVLNILDKLKEGTGIDIDFVHLDFEVLRKSASAMFEATTNISETETQSSNSYQNDETVPEQNDDIQSDENVVSQSDNQVLESNTDSSASAKPLTFVLCKFFVVPLLSFMGVAPNFEESKKKAAILLLKHINSLDKTNCRKNNFFENFSSGDEADT